MVSRFNMYIWPCLLRNVSTNGFIVFSKLIVLVTNDGCAKICDFGVSTKICNNNEP